MNNIDDIESFRSTSIGTEVDAAINEQTAGGRAHLALRLQNSISPNEITNFTVGLDAFLHCTCP